MLWFLGVLLLFDKKKKKTSFHRGYKVAWPSLIISNIQKNPWSYSYRYNLCFVNPLSQDQKKSHRSSKEFLTALYRPIISLVPQLGGSLDLAIISYFAEFRIQNLTTFFYIQCMQKINFYLHELTSSLLYLFTKFFQKR